MRVPEISLGYGLLAQNKHDLCRYYKYTERHKQTQYLPAYTVSFMVVPSVRAWEFRVRTYLPVLQHNRRIILGKCHNICDNYMIFFFLIIKLKHFSSSPEKRLIFIIEFRKMLRRQSYFLFYLLHTFSVRETQNNK